MTRKGIVYLVGAGPGDPGLITRRGAEMLARADVVIYDHLANPRLLDLASPSAERIYAGKSTGHYAIHQDKINQLLIERAQAGQTVVRLKGGDPYVFGRGAEEAECLQAAGVSFRVIPGVTAGIGATACAGIPVTHRRSASSVAFVTGHDDPNKSGMDWRSLALFPGTLVIYMGVGRLRQHCQTLIDAGKSPKTPAAAVHAGSLARQKTVVATLETLADQVAQANLTPPTLFVIGDVVSHRPDLNWFEQLPLFGQRIVITRPIDESQQSANDLEELGAEVLVAPSVQILPLDDHQTLDDTLDRLHQFHWLVFTSGNGVRHFFNRLKTQGKDLRAVGHLKLAAIGPATAKSLAQFHLVADLVPQSYRSEDLAAALIPHVQNQRVLLARADRGRTILKDELEQVCQVEQVAVYRNVDSPSLPTEIIDQITQAQVHWITLTSSAIAQRLHQLLPAAAHHHILNGTIRLASISPITSETARQIGWPIAAEATEYNWNGLVQALSSSRCDGKHSQSNASFADE